jgi:hypothetical protein
MDSGCAGGIFSFVHFIPPFRCSSDNVHRGAEHCAHERRRIKLRFQSLGGFCIDFMLYKIIISYGKIN